VRAFLGGEVAADTPSVLVWEMPYYPTDSIAFADLRA
jgi:hypothetical protein